MKKPNKSEAELNAIRAALYEEIKGMTPSEVTAYMKAKVAPLHDKYSIRPVRKSQKPAL
ncbi:MAG: hypothetical protein LBK23_10940 [Oscillospiraceae bacterium]|jgi:hypothetical protein|nr:hypothetical protein [Oscillospiraceae bacterium]